MLQYCFTLLLTSFTFKESVKPMYFNNIYFNFIFILNINFNKGYPNHTSKIYDISSNLHFANTSNKISGFNDQLAHVFTLRKMIEARLAKWPESSRIHLLSEYIM